MSTSVGYHMLKFIVANDVIKADPPQIYGRFLVRSALASSLGAITVGIHGPILDNAISTPAFENRFDLYRNNSNFKDIVNLHANVTTTYHMAGFAGALLSIPMASRLGRRGALLLALAIMLAGDIMQIASWGQIAVLYIGRFITGLAVGIFCCVLPIYMAESSPRAIRGLLVSTFHLFQVVGSWLGFWISYGTHLYVASDSDAQWVMPIAMQLFPAVLFAFSIYALSDTARSLLHRGKRDDAHRVLAGTLGLDREHSYIMAELDSITSEIDIHSPPTSTFGRAFKVPFNRRRLVIAIGLIIAQSMSGYYSVFSHARLFLMRTTQGGFKLQLYTSILNGILMITFSIIFTFFVIDRLGRRRSLLWTIPIQAICLFAVGILSAIEESMTSPTYESISYAEVVFAYLCNCIFQLGLGPVPMVYLAEIPGTQLRALTVGVAVAVQWLFLMGLSRALGHMLYYISFLGNGFGTHLIFGACFLISFAFVWYFIPETKGVALENMEELFSRRPSRSTTAEDHTDDSSNISTICGVEILGKDTSQ